MNIKTFIDRPILAGVISVLILLLGLIGLSQLPVEQFPEIAPPTVSVSAAYAGANAETVQKSVLVPLEEAINGVEDMMYMVSSATNSGSASIQIYFRQGTDGDMAMVNVQNRIASAQSLLPAEVTRSGVTVRKRQTSRIKTLAVYSPDNSFDRKFITNYLKINIEPRLSRIAGVGEVDVRGGDYSLRIWLDPGKMAKFGLMPSDISAVLAEQNLEAPTGTLGAESANTFRYVLKYRGRYENVTDYENMVIRAESDGTVLRLRDVASIELGERSYDYIGLVNGHPGTTISISQTSGSNATEIIIAVDKESETKRHQGVIAYTTDYEYYDLDDIIQAKKSEKGGFIVLCDGIEDVHNLGSIIRVAECAGADGVVIPKSGSASVTESVIRISAGAAEHMKVAKVPNLNQAVEKLQKSGYWVYALEAGGEDIYKEDFAGNVALIVGGEDSGVKRLTKEKCDKILYKFHRIFLYIFYFFLKTIVHPSAIPLVIVITPSSYVPSII